MNIILYREGKSANCLLNEENKTNIVRNAISNIKSTPNEYSETSDNSNQRIKSPDNNPDTTVSKSVFSFLIVLLILSLNSKRN
jgi:hypothetical protein